MKTSVQRGDVVLVDLDGNKGSEQGNSEDGGPRPCVVVQNNVGNAGRPVTIVVPLTDASKDRGYREHVRVTAAELGYGSKESIADCGHIITIDGDARIRDKKNTLSAEVMSRIDAGIRSSLAL